MLTEAQRANIFFKAKFTTAYFGIQHLLPLGANVIIKIGFLFYLARNTSKELWNELEMIIIEETCTAVQPYATLVFG